jgi:hypothetical protein
LCVLLPSRCCRTSFLTLILCILLSRRISTLIDVHTYMRFDTDDTQLYTGGHRNQTILGPNHVSTSRHYPCYSASRRPGTAE